MGKDLECLNRFESHQLQGSSPRTTVVARVYEPEENSQTRPIAHFCQNSEIADAIEIKVGLSS
jgi:hypothetical protein